MGSYRPNDATKVDAWSADDGTQFDCRRAAVNHNVKLDTMNTLRQVLNERRKHTDDELDAIMEALIRCEPMVIEFLSRFGDQGAAAQRTRALELLSTPGGGSS